MDGDWGSDMSAVSEGPEDVRWRREQVFLPEGEAGPEEFPRLHNMSDRVPVQGDRAPGRPGAADLRDR